MGRFVDSSSICINQADIEERNAQVKKMGDIYSLADRVVLWLGLEEDDSKHALSTLHHFSTQVEYLKDGSMGDAPGAEHIQWWQPGCPLPYDERTWSSLVAVFRRSWFTRVWVLQEAQLANPSAIVQCGFETMPWVALRKAMFVLSFKRSVPEEVRKLLGWLDWE
jgi:Heterokaryon incompatibility protein (HET)